MTLRRALWSRGLRYRIDVSALPGRPDIVFSTQRVVIFCDGDFWHGRDVRRRVQKLRRGHNAKYWVAKIRANVVRDRRNNRALRAAGWRVFRFWETDIHRHVERIAVRVARQLKAQT